MFTLPKSIWCDNPSESGLPEDFFDQKHQQVINNHGDRKSPKPLPDGRLIAYVNGKWS